MPRTKKYSRKRNTSYRRNYRKSRGKNNRNKKYSNLRRKSNRKSNRNNRNKIKRNQGGGGLEAI